MSEQLGQDQIDRLIAGDRLRREIEEFYLPAQLIDAIVELGAVPQRSEETQVGVGFIDIADYSFISKFLSPSENQAVLNGLFTAFNFVLKRHGGYLNKIEGDSLMFHFGGMTDRTIRGMEPVEARRHIARELFYTCVEMQRVCALFNQANDRFVDQDADPQTMEDLQRAFDIIRTMRSSMELGTSLQALYQIRVRVGANIGEVTTGNLGPRGAKQWDIIGVPVINAKRMEATAPIGGLRISEDLYKVLEETGVVEAYYERFRREAGAMFGVFKDISMDELFKFSSVVLKDKRNVAFNTYSVQVNPRLPEAVAEQTEVLLERDELAADRIIQFLQYYRGNRFVVDAIERTFRDKRVNIRKHDILKVVHPRTFRRLEGRHRGDWEALIRNIDSSYSLYHLFEKLGQIQDRVKEHETAEMEPLEDADYERRMAHEIANVVTNYRLVEKSVRLNNYFHNYVYPLVFRSIKTSILEHQSRISAVEELEASAEPATA